MSIENKAKAAGAVDPEFEKIMGEIQELQQGIAQATEVAKVRSKPTGMNGGATEAAEAAADLLVGSTTPAVSADHSEMHEFHAESASEAPMEDTLGDLKDDGQAGSGLLDSEVVSGEAPEEEVVEEVVAEEAPAEENNEIETEETVMSKPAQLRTVGDPTEAGGTTEGTLSMTLTGNMRLSLRYEFEGQEVTVGFTDGALHLELADGTEFKIPIRRGGKNRAAA